MIVKIDADYENFFLEPGFLCWVQSSLTLISFI